MRVNTNVKAKNYSMANKGAGFEQEVKYANEAYKRRGLALIQKISTPWKVIRSGKKIISAFPEGKSTLDFRGTIKGGVSISFDCKESENKKGLTLKYIEPHQIDYIRNALVMGEVSFILCYMKAYDKRYLIPGQIVLDYWDYWQANKGKRNCNYIAMEDMIEVRSSNGILLDYLLGLEVLT